jgi:drug/metabolite transporter (DMT)-like permease
MPLRAVLLVLLSCFLHAWWNLLLKRARNKLAFTALYLPSACVLCLPVFLWLAPAARIPSAGWGCIAATSVVYFGYFVGLAMAYQGGELSVMYPLTRGLGPALAFVGGVVVLSERPSGLGALGAALILCGVWALHWQGRSAARLGVPLKALLMPSSLAALFVGFTYSTYSLIDKVGVGRLHINPLVYIYLTYVGSSLFVIPWLTCREGVDALRAEWRLNAASAAAVGVLNYVAYGMVLYAMSLPNTPVSYVVPLRTVSVLIGVLLGVRVLGEGRLAAKLVGALFMMAGIVLMAWKG